MWTATREQALGRRAEPPPPVLAPEGFLPRLLAVVGVDPDPERIRAADHALRLEGCSWQERIERACEALGLRARRMRGTVAQASRSVGPEHPIVAFVPGMGFLLASDRRGRALQIEQATGAVWASRGEIAAWLDPTRMGTADWVAIDPPWHVPTDEPLAAESHFPPPPRTPFQRLRGLVKQERHDVGVVVVYAIAVGALSLAIPIAVQALVNTVAFGSLLQPVAVLTLLLFGALAFAATLQGLQAWVVEIIQRRIFLRFVGDLAHRLPRVRLSSFDTVSGPALVNRYFDIFTVQKATSVLLVGGLEIVLTASVGLLVLAFYHPLLLAFALVFVAVVIVTLFGLGRRGVKTAIVQSKAKYYVADWLEEIARLPVAFKLAGGPDLAKVETDRLACDYLRARDAHFRVVFRQLIAALALQVFASAGILGIGGWLVIERELTLGQLVAAELIVTAVVASYAKIGKKLSTAYDLLAALDKVGQLLDLPMDPVPAGDPPAPSAMGSEVVVENLRFSFPGHDPLFENFALTIAPGERVAIMGTRGAGRSTLTDLIAGIREPERGSVLIDGIDARDASRLDRRVALVRGEAAIASTLADNVAFGRPEIDVRRVREALRTVDLLDEVAKLPSGLGTRLTPTGAPLSHGQIVRLTLARAIAGRPSLLLVDGVLDGLDAPTKNTALEAVFDEDAPHTLVVVTDDEDVACRCDRVIRLERGQLVGTSEELHG